MTYEVYRYVFLSGAIAAGIMLAVSILLFFVLHIPKVLNDLTGRSARKAIDNIRKQNEATGNKSYQSSAVNLNRGKLTDKISDSGTLQSNTDSPFSIGTGTEKISTAELKNQEQSGETTVLDGENETTVLSTTSETTVLSADANSAFQYQEGGETMLLQPEEPAWTGAAADEFRVEFEITYIHTDEVIV